VAVHGLGANPDHAWVRHKATTPGLEKDVHWLKDLLPQTFQNHQPSIYARIFCFNYQSAWLGGQLSKNRLENIAGRLLDDLYHTKIKVCLLCRSMIVSAYSVDGRITVPQADR
jgi:hypothetical protein